MKCFSIASVSTSIKLLMQCVSRRICSLLVVLEEIKSSGSKLLLGQNLATSLSALDNTNTRSATCTLVNNRSSSLDRGRSRCRCGSRSGSRSGSRLLGSQLLLIGGSLGGSGLGFGLLLGSLLLSGLFCCLLLSGLSLGSLLFRLCLGLLGLGRPGISLGLSGLLTLSLGLGLGSLSLLNRVEFEWIFVGEFNEFGIFKMVQIDQTYSLYWHSWRSYSSHLLGGGLLLGSSLGGLLLSLLGLGLRVFHNSMG